MLQITKNAALCLFLLLCCSRPLDAQLSDQAEVSLITCRPGDDISSAYGHTAIRIYDPANQLDILYNYGMFSFQEPNFLGKFLRGKLMYWLGVESYRAFINNYSNEKRSVIEQVLDLEQGQKDKIFRALRDNLKPSNRRYLYDFFFDNCSTRPRDILINNIDDLEFHENTNHEYSFRNLIHEYTRASPWYDFGIDLIIGSIADRKAMLVDQMFLPEYLMEHLEGSNIIKETKLLVDYESEADKRKQLPFFTPSLLFVLLLFIELVLFIKMKSLQTGSVIKYDNLWFFLAGIAGLLILFMWFGTDHIATKANLNLLWLNPLYFLLLWNKENKIILYTILIMLIIALSQTVWIQEFHTASLLVILLLFLKCLRKLRTKNAISEHNRV